MEKEAELPSDDEDYSSFLKDENSEVPCGKYV